FLYFSLTCDGHTRHLHSFPTRRSSDLREYTMPDAAEKSTGNPEQGSPASGSTFEAERSSAGLLVAARHHAAFALAPAAQETAARSEEHTSELQSRGHLVCRLLLEKKKN